MPFSRKDNVVSSAVQHPALVTGGAVGFGQFSDPQQNCFFNNGPKKAVVEFAVVPGNPVTLSHWWFAQPGRSATVPHETYDGTVTLNTDGTVTVPTGTTPLNSVTLDQTKTPDVAAGLASIPFVTGTTGANPDPNATAADGSSVPYATVYAGTPTQTIISTVVYKTDGGDPTTFDILDSWLLQSPDALLPPLKPAAVGPSAIDPSGRIVAVRLVDLGGNPSIVTAIDATKLPTIAVNGGAGNGQAGSTGTIQLANPVWDLPDPATYLPYVLFPLGFDVAPTDIITFSCQDSWCTTVVGACRAAADLPLVNLAGGNVLPVPPTPTMGVGVNLSIPSGMMVTPFVDLIRGLGDWINQSGFTDPSITTDAAGNITSIGTAARAQCPVVGGGNQEGDSSQTYRQCRPGVYTLIYETGAVYTLNGNGPDIGHPGTPTILSGPTDNGDGTTTIVYRFDEPAPHWGPIIDLWCTTPGVLHHIYPPDPASPLTRSLDGTAKFHPDFLAEIAGLQCLRHMDSGRINDSNVVDFAHFNVVTNLSYSRQLNDVITAQIVRIEPYTDAANKYAGQGGVLILVTTAAPHGIATNGAQSGILAGFSPDGFATVSPAGTTNLNGQFTLIDVRSPTTFVFRSASGTGRTLAAASTTTDFGSAATVTVGVRNIQWPPSEIVDLCNINNSDLYLPVPHGASDLCLWDAGDPSHSLFGLVFGPGGLSPSRTIYIPYSNEWLFNNSFLQYAWVQQQGNLAGQSLVTWGVGRAAQVHALAIEAAAAFGWTGTIKRVMPGNFGIPTDGAAALDAAVAISAPVDGMEIAPYIGNYPGDPDFGTIFDTLFTQPMFMDMWDEFLIYGTWQGLVAANRDNLHARYPAAELLCYEGGLSDGSLSGSGDLRARSRAWARHWRQFRSYTYYLGNILQANGVKLFNHFTLSGQLNPPFNFQIYLNCDQADGTGDPSENAAPDNFTTNPVSEVGGALHRWASLVNSGGGGAAAPGRRVFRSPAFRSRALCRR